MSHTEEVGINILMEAMNKLQNSLQDVAENEKKEILKDKQEALEKLKDYYNPEYINVVTFEPIEILEMLDADVHFGVKKNEISFTAKVRCSDKIRILKYSETEFSYGYMDPPEFDFKCIEIENIK